MQKACQNGAAGPVIVAILCKTVSQQRQQMIDLANIAKSYAMGEHSVRALADINLRIDQGEFVAIQGSSGSGKSTLLNILGILDTADSGQYTLEAHPIENLSATDAARYRNRFIGFVFQSFNLIHHKSALDNVALPLYYQRIARRKRNKIAMEYLDRVGLLDRASHKPAELSGGQSQRVAIARALITQPALLLADEPTGALDTQTSDQIMQIFKEVNADGMTVVLVTHEPGIAQQTSRSIQLRDGRIIADDSIVDNHLADNFVADKHDVATYEPDSHVGNDRTQEPFKRGKYQGFFGDEFRGDEKR